MVEFIRVRSVAPWGSQCSFGFIGSIQARPGRYRVHSGSLGSFGGSIGIVLIIRVRWVHSGAPWPSEV